MSETQKEFDWYSGEIEKAQKRHDRAWGEYSEARQQLDRLERERATLLRKMMRRGDGEAAP